MNRRVDTCATQTVAEYAIGRCKLQPSPKRPSARHASPSPLFYICLFLLKREGKKNPFYAFQQKKTTEASFERRSHFEFRLLAGQCSSETVRPDLVPFPETGKRSENQISAPVRASSGQSSGAEEKFGFWRERENHATSPPPPQPYTVPALAVVALLDTRGHCNSVIRAR